MRHLPLIVLLLAPTPAFAQFPPPGVYECTVETGENLGQLNLFVAGDYSFRNVEGNSQSGQIASAGSDVNPLSGPLKAMGLVGTFATDPAGETVFSLTGADGLEVTCR